MFCIKLGGCRCTNACFNAGLSSRNLAESPASPAGHHTIEVAESGGWGNTAGDDTGRMLEPFQDETVQIHRSNGRQTCGLPSQRGKMSVLVFPEKTFRL